MEQERDFTVEEIFDKLNKTVTRLESREISLEDSFRLYTEGMELLRLCNEKIDTVEKKMLQMNENGDLSEF